MFLHDGVRHRQTEAGALADLLRREKRIEDLRPHILRHTRPVVVHLEDDGVVVDVVPGAQDERAAAVGADHGLFRVDDEIQQHLLDLMRIGEDARQARRQRLEDRDVAEALFVRPQRQRLTDDVVEVDHRARGVALARERQQVADDFGRALRLAEDRLEPAPRLIVDLDSVRGVRPR